MSYEAEFKTVELILRSDANTCGVDAFALSLIKCERQLRRLVTHLVFQFPCFDCDNIFAFRDALGNNRQVYFDGFIRGFDALYPRPIAELVGQDYESLRDRLNEAIDFRNKIFHGQLTSRYLSREDLVGYILSIRNWCRSLSTSAIKDIGYDGFGRNSLQKSKESGIWERYKVQIKNVEEYRVFIRNNMQR